MKAGDWRMTVETLHAGQLRPYADTLYKYRVFFERAESAEKYVPSPWVQHVVESHLRGICGWKVAGEGDWASPRLDYIKQLGPGLWEFSVTLAYTD